MDIQLLGIILIPIAISIFCKFVLKFDISWKEFVTQAVIGVACLSLIWFLGKMSSGYDVETLNGQVTGKKQVMVSCSHSYSCNCRQVTSGSGKDQTTTTVCDTCYEHSYDFDWDVYSTIGTFTIGRVDSQGVNEPERFTIVNNGDPVSGQHSYQNWVKASVDSLYHQDLAAEERYKQSLPEYNGEIYDYYKTSRVYTVGTNLSTKRLWNREISRVLSIAGPPKQINMVVVVVEGAGRDYAHALRRKWGGFKKNEAVVVIGLNKGVVVWAESMSWSKKSIFDINMRDMAEKRIGQNINSVDPVQFMNDAQVIIHRDFLRRPMKEFEYLRGEIPPPTWLVWLSVILATLFGIGSSIIFNNVELFETYNRYRY